MARLVATMGTQPGSVYETLLNLCRGRYDAGERESPPISISEVALIHTSAREVVNAYRVAKLLIACGNHIMPSELRLACTINKIIGVPVDVEDVNSRSSFEAFYNAVYRNVAQGDVVDVTGGRVAMAVAASMAAVKAKAMVVATVIPHSKYSEINAAKNAIISTYNVKDIVEGLEEGRISCIELGEKYRELVKNLARLVTGSASTYVLYP